MTGDFARDNDVSSVDGALRLAGLHGGDQEIEGKLLVGGRSNLTYAIRTDRGDVVLRRPPASHVLATAHNMRREYDILSALQNTAVPAATPLGYWQEPSVNGGVEFYVMSFVDGVVVDSEAIAGFTPAERHAVGLRLIEVLASIHSVAVDASPTLAAMNRGSGYLRRQVSRWQRQWVAASIDDDPQAEWVCRWLEENTVDDAASALIHGDFRLDNCIVASDDAMQVQAVVDWEMGTVGDPFIDLATFLTYWVRPDDPADLREMFPTANTSLAEGFPSREALIERYEATMGRAWDNRSFHFVLAFFKLACICQGIHSRYAAGGTRGPGFEGYDRRAATLLNYAQRIAKGEYRFA